MEGMGALAEVCLLKGGIATPADEEAVTDRRISRAPAYDRYTRSAYLGGSRGHESGRPLVASQHEFDSPI